MRLVPAILTAFLLTTLVPPAAAADQCTLIGCVKDPYVQRDDDRVIVGWTQCVQGHCEPRAVTIPVPDAPEQPIRNPQVRQNADGSVTVSYYQCSQGGSCQRQSRTVPLLSPYVDVGEDARGNVTVTAGYCEGDGSCVTRTQVLPVNATPWVCFAYNPSALTNACVATGPETYHVPTPDVVFGAENETLPFVEVGSDPRNVCVIGDQCVLVPVPTAEPGSTTQPVPTAEPTVEDTPLVAPGAGGYVEATALCAFDAPCRLTL